LPSPWPLPGLLFYFRPAGARYRILAGRSSAPTLILTLLHTKPYFLAAAYPILFAAGAVVFERLRPVRWLAWLRPAYVALLALTAVLLAPRSCPSCRRLQPCAPTGRSRSHSATDWLGHVDGHVEQVTAGLPPDQRAQACVLTENYGEAGALSLLAAPGRLPPIISGHNNYYLWGPGAVHGSGDHLVGYPRAPYRTRAYTPFTPTSRWPPPNTASSAWTVRITCPSTSCSSRQVDLPRNSGMRSNTLTEAGTKSLTEVCAGRTIWLLYLTQYHLQ